MVLILGADVGIIADALIGEVSVTRGLDVVVGSPEAVAGMVVVNGGSGAGRTFLMARGSNDG